MPTAFVTGGAGFIGSNVVRRLLAAEFETHVYDSFTMYMTPDPKVEQPGNAFRLRNLVPQAKLIRGNTLNNDYLRRCITSTKPDVIIHMAAMPLAAVAVEHSEEAFESIITSTRNILEILRDAKHKCRLVYISSSMVYGDFQSDEIQEDAPKSPKDIYGAFKLAGEVVVNAYSRNYGIETVVVRPSAVYGPTDTNQRVIQKFIQSAMKGEALTLDGDGSLKLDFTYVEDCAEGIFKCATHPNAAGKTFNITRGQGRSLKELVDILAEHFPQLRVEHREVPSYIPKRSTLSIEYARRELGFAPAVSLEEGVARYVRHLKSAPY